MRSSVFKNILHLGIIVKDLDASVRTYADKYGVGPWEYYEADKYISQVRIKGQSGCFSSRMASAFVGDVMLEVIQPLDHDSEFARFLASHGEGVHHIAFETDDHQQTLDFFSEAGVEPLLSGKFAEEEFIYLDTRKDLGVVSEISHAPDDAAMPAPDSIYPDPAGDKQQ